jgi:hypothetical protein
MTANLVTEIDLPDWNANTNPNCKYTFTYEQTPNKSGYYTGRGRHTKSLVNSRLDANSQAPQPPETHSRDDAEKGDRSIIRKRYMLAGGFLGAGHQQKQKAVGKLSLPGGSEGLAKQN